VQGQEIVRDKGRGKRDTDDKKKRDAPQELRLAMVSTFTVP